MQFFDNSLVGIILYTFPDFKYCTLNRNVLNNNALLAMILFPLFISILPYQKSTWPVTQCQCHRTVWSELPIVFVWNHYTGLWCRPCYLPFPLFCWMLESDRNRSARLWWSQSISKYNIVKLSSIFGCTSMFTNHMKERMLLVTLNFCFFLLTEFFRVYMCQRDYDVAQLEFIFLPGRLCNIGNMCSPLQSSVVILDYSFHHLCIRWYPVYSAPDVDDTVRRRYFC